MATDTNIYTVEHGRRPAPQMNCFRPFVTAELQRRKLLPDTIMVPLVRMVSCLANPSTNTADAYQYFTMGLHGYTDDDVNIFDMTYGSSREIVGYAYRNGPGGFQKTLIDTSQLSRAPFEEYKNEHILLDEEYNELEAAATVQADRQKQDHIPGAGAFPMPGITEVSIERFAMGAGVRAIVKWQCYNRQQLEFLRHHFMMAGNFVVLEYGQQFNNKKLVKTLDYTDSQITQILANSVTQGRKYTVQNYVLPNDGNYDYLVGNIGNFTVAYDAPRNTYMCSTAIVASGEMLFGLSIPSTAFLTNPDSQPLVTNTFEEYFQYGGRFDDLISRPENLDVTKGLVSHAISLNQGQVKRVTVDETAIKKAEQINSIDLSGLSRNPHDYTFISWTFLIRDIFYDMINRIEPSNVDTDGNQIIRKELSNFYNFYDVTLLGPPTQQSTPQTPGTSTTPAATSTAVPGTEERRLYVGDNVFLRSTDPETMIIVKQSMLPNIPIDFQGAGYFGNPKGDRGELTSGIWLNAKMVRECFLQSTTLEQAMRSITIRMNNAVAGYWNLVVYNDDDYSTMRIIDDKFCQLDDPLNGGKLYQFNVNTRGECLKIDLDSAYPPEVVTQLMIVAKLKSDPNAFVEALKKYPLFGLTSHYAMAMNWTALEDIVFKQVQRDRGATPPSAIAANIEYTSAGTRDANNALIGQATGKATVGPTQHNPDLGKSAAAGPAGTQPVATPSEADLKNNAGINPKSSAGIQALYDTIARWQPSINKAIPNLSSAAQDFQFDPELLIKAIIAQESSGVNGITRPESHLDEKAGYPVYDCGLMQVLNVNDVAVSRFGLISPSNKAAHPTDNVVNDRTQFLANNADFNIDVATRYLASLFNLHAAKVNHDLDFVLASYNAGPGNAAHRYATNTEAPVPIDWKGTTTPLIFGPVIAGSFANQSYVNNVLYYYNQFLLRKKQAGLATTTSFRAITHPTTLAGLTQAQVEERIEQLTLELTFGDPIIAMCNLNKTNMMNIIISDGLNRHDQRISNSYVAPFPTTAKIDIQIVGLSGISIFDVFSVDKLPYIYDNYGVFHITQINESISSAGWRTQLHGVFRFLYFNPAQAKASLLANVIY